MTETPTIPEQNQLLAALPGTVKDRVVPKLKVLELNMGDVIHEPGQPIEFVYFPINCIISLQNIMQNGASVEIAVVGNEGMVDVAVCMGGESSPSRATVRSRGLAYRLPARELKAEFHRHDGVLGLLLRYTQALITQMSQIAVCNRHHSIDQQLCRWLLQTLDRIPGNELTTTQELIATMLGVRREGITEAAGKLQKQGVIRYHRGHITVLDRSRLETLCCECYVVVKRETDRLAPAPRQGGTDSVRRA